MRKAPRSFQSWFCLHSWKFSGAGQPFFPGLGRGMSKWEWIWKLGILLTKSSGEWEKRRCWGKDSPWGNERQWSWKRKGRTQRQWTWTGQRYGEWKTIVLELNIEDFRIFCIRWLWILREQFFSALLPPPLHVRPCCCWCRLTHISLWRLTHIVESWFAVNFPKNALLLLLVQVDSWQTF